MKERSLDNVASLATRDEGTSHACAEPLSADLLDALRSCLPVLPVLVTQLQEMAQQVEQAVVAVCGNFQGNGSASPQGGFPGSRW